MVEDIVDFDTVDSDDNPAEEVVISDYSFHNSESDINEIATDSETVSDNVSEEIYSDSENKETEREPGVSLMSTPVVPEWEGTGDPNRKYRRSVYLNSLAYAPFWDIIYVLVRPSERLSQTEMHALLTEYLSTPIF